MVKYTRPRGIVRQFQKPPNLFLKDRFYTDYGSITKYAPIGRILVEKGSGLFYATVTQNEIIIVRGAGRPINRS
jgi:hypothetical protein